MIIQAFYPTAEFKNKNKVFFTEDELLPLTIYNEEVKFKDERNSLCGSLHFDNIYFYKGCDLNLHSLYYHLRANLDSSLHLANYPMNGNEKFYYIHINKTEMKKLRSIYQKQMEEWCWNVPSKFYHAIFQEDEIVFKVSNFVK